MVYTNVSIKETSFWIVVTVTVNRSLIVLPLMNDISDRGTN
jgi:hypothetical protein